MNNKNDYFIGMLFALSAAALNASIGVLSKILISSGFTPSGIAFSKTLLGFIFLSLLLLFLKYSPLKTKWYQVALCSFLGIFVLFYFETAAYKIETAANVVVVLMASASISAMILSRVILGDKIYVHSIFGAFCAILGIFLIFGVNFQSGFSLYGTVLSIIAGSGYGAFSVMVKKMKLSGGLQLTRQLLFFGVIFLLLPASHDGVTIGEFNLTVILAICALAVLPTILGFFCTTKAIQYLKPTQVQILELSEPIFAAFLALLVLQENPSAATLMGGAFILFGICLSNNLLYFFNKRPVRDGG